MIHKVFFPPKNLKPFVHSVQIIERDWNDNGLDSWKIIPYGLCGIFINYKDVCQQKFSESSIRQFPQTFIAGLTDQSFEIFPTGDIGIIIINVYPSALYTFLNIPGRELVNEIVDLNLVIKKVFDPLRDQVIYCSTPYNMASLVFKTLINLARIHQPKPGFLNFSENMFRKSSGNVKIADVANLSGVSVSKLERYFKYEIGLSPKNFSRIMRFNSFFKLYQMDTFENIYDIMYQCGYYDQAHFIKEFKHFTGETPSRFLNKQLKASDFFSGR